MIETETFRQLLNQIPEEHRAWWLNGIITGFAITTGPDTREYVIQQLINPLLTADEVTALEAISFVLTESPPITYRPG